MRWCYLCIVILAVFALQPVKAQLTPIKVDEISKFVVEINVNDNVHVKCSMTIQNLIDKPLVPGIGEIRLQKVTPKKVWIIPIPFTEERHSVRVYNLKAYSTDGKNINTKVEYKENYTVIHYEIWYPLEPYGNTTVIFEYDSPDLVEKGLLFKETSIPIGTTIDIKDVDVIFKSNWKLVYVKEGAESIPAGSITFYTAEFSMIPLPNIGYKWSTTFWLIILTITTVSIIIFRKIYN